jgi:hypothetical protein
MQEVVGEVLLDDVTLVAAANDELVDPEVAVELEDVPKNWLATHFHHRFGFEAGFF